MELARSAQAVLFVMRETSRARRAESKKDVEEERFGCLDDDHPVT